MKAMKEVEKIKEPQDESSSPDDSMASAAPSYMYRCPGCGALVDSRDSRAIRLHHSHVLNPWLKARRTRENSHACKEIIKDK